MIGGVNYRSVFGYVFLAVYYLFAIKTFEGKNYISSYNVVSSSVFTNIFHCHVLKWFYRCSCWSAKLHFYSSNRTVFSELLRPAFVFCSVNKICSACTLLVDSCLFLLKVKCYKSWINFIFCYLVWYCLLN